LYAVVAALLPVVYSLIVGFLPSFPLAEPDFVLFMLWVVGLIVGGWQVSKGIYTMQNRFAPAFQKSKDPLGIDLNGLKPIIKALITVLIPVFWGWLKDAYQDFPLTSEQLLAIVLWIIGLVIGGWQLGKAYYVHNAMLFKRDTKYIR